MILRLLLGLLVLLSNVLFAENEAESDIIPPIPLSDLERGICPIVHGCVNTITGDFVETMTDLKVVGPEPLTFERIYSSADFMAEDFFGAWRHNQIIKLENHRDPDDKNKRHFSYTSQGGQTVRFRDEESDIARFSKKLNVLGFTNCSHGVLGALTNLKNTKIFPQTKKPPYVITTTGSRQEFTEFGKRHFLIKQEIKRNGHQLTYSFAQNDRLLQEVILSNSANKTVFSFLRFAKPEYSNKGCKLTLNGSDGQAVTYIFERLPDLIEDDRFILTEVQSTSAPTVSYKYKKTDSKISQHGKDKGKHITLKSLPKGRYREIEYYNHKNWKRIEQIEYVPYDRVKAIIEPTGSDSSAKTLYTFRYWPGSTTVTDAFGNNKIYRFNNNGLTSIESYKGLEPYYCESFGWADDHLNFGNLLYTRYQDGALNTVKAKVFHYDIHGNVCKEDFYGNITGRGPGIVWNGNAPIANSSDCYEKHYCYNEKHFVVAQKENNGRGALFTYHPDKDFVLSKLITMHGKVVSRTFLEYDENGVVVKKIEDNGSGQEKNDLAKVTQRLITKIIPTKKAPYGLSERADEFFLDLKTGKECLLHRTVNEYSKRGLLTRQHHCDSNQSFCYTLSWDYNAHGKCIRETNALGQVIEREYDENDNLISERTPTQIKKFFYDLANRLIATDQTDFKGLQLITHKHYDVLGRCIADIDAQGHETRHIYDEFGREIETILPATPTEHGTLVHTRITKEYDVFGNVTKLTDQQGYATNTTYNVYGKPLKICYPDGSSETFEYSLDGMPALHIAKNGTKTKFYYDPLSRLTKQETISPKGTLLKTENFQYDGVNLLSSTDATGLTCLYEYDYAGRVKAIKEGCKHVTYEYDALGRQSKVSEYYSKDASLETTYLYDHLNRVIEEKKQDSRHPEKNRITYFSYDYDGNISKKTEGTSVTKFEYNGFKQVILMVDPLGNKIRTSYNYYARNALGQTVFETNVTDSLGNQTITTYNPQGKIGCLQQKNSLGALLSKKELFYSGTGDLQECRELVLPSEKPKIITTRWFYDSMHQLTKLVEAVATVEQKSMQHQYNALGQKAVTIKPDGIKLIYEYDDLGRQIHIHDSAKTINYVYTHNLRDQPILVEDKVRNSVTDLAYDSDGRLVKETLGNKQTIRYQYDNFDRPVEIELPDQSKILYTRDGLYLNSVTRINKEGAAKHEYTQYDQFGQVLEAKLADKKTQLAYAYDAKGQNIQIQNPTFEINLLYDSVGNLTSQKGRDPARKNFENTYKYNDLYQITKESGRHTGEYEHDSHFNCIKRNKVARQFNSLHQLLQEGDTRYKYEANGNLITRDRPGEHTEFIYDGLDRLVAVVKADQRFEYVYDAFNRRISKLFYHRQDSKWILTDTQHFLYQGQNEIGSTDNLGTINELRVLGMGKGAEIGAAVLMEFGANIYIPLHDTQGSVHALLDRSGRLQEWYSYSSFGKEQVHDVIGEATPSTSLGNPWRYSSKRIDPETGFVYFGRRYYDPDSMRWTTPDPLGFDAGPNLYAYVNNNPLIHFDLYGLFLSCPSFDWSINCFDGFGSFCDGFNSSFANAPSWTEFETDIDPSFGLAFERSDFDLERFVSIHTEGNLKLQNVEFGLVNGIMNYANDFQNSMKSTSNCWDGVQVTGLFDPTKYLKRDLMATGFMKLGFNTNAVEACAQMMRDGLDKAEIFVMKGHSNGGQIIYNAVKLLTENQRGRIIVGTFGSAKMIFADELGLKDAVNYIGYENYTTENGARCMNLDFVPFIGDYIGIRKGWNRNDGSIVNIPNLGTGIHHGFCEETYQTGLKDFNKYLKKKHGIGW